MANDPWAGINDIGAIDQKLYDPPKPAATPPPVQPGTKSLPQPLKKRSDPLKKPEIMKTRNPETVVQSQDFVEKPGKYSTILTRSLVKKIKNRAIDMDMSDYEVVETALIEYFDRHK